MKHVDLDAYDEAIKQFILSRSPEPSGSVLELNGEPVAHVLPVPAAEPTDKWDVTKDARRCERIDREIAGKHTPDETVELRTHQAAMLRHRRRVV